MHAKMAFIHERTPGAGEESPQRMVLVDGLSCAEAGFRIHPPLSRVAANRALRACGDMKGCQAGWQMVTVCVPEEYAEQIKRITANFGIMADSKS